MISNNRLKNILVSITTVFLATLSSCGDTMTYSDHKDDEKEAIENFIKSKNIAVIGSMPETDDEWIDNDGREIYYYYSSGRSRGLYYHQIKKGEGDVIPQDGWTAYVRYAGYRMNGDMLYNCTAQYAPDPQSFKIQPRATDNELTFGTGFQQAVKNLRIGGKCKIIVPFEIGNSDNTTLKGVLTSDAGEYRPMYYEIELVGLE